MKGTLLWVLLIVVFGIAAVIARQYSIHLSEIDEKKEALWRKLTDNQSASLAQCLQHYYSISKCKEIEQTVDKAIGR
jgi:hypothetical protein